MDDACELCEALRKPVRCDSGRGARAEIESLRSIWRMIWRRRGQPVTSTRGNQPADVLSGQPIPALFWDGAPDGVSRPWQRGSAAAAEFRLVRAPVSLERGH